MSATLEAGRALDRLVARKVLGLTLHEHRGHPKCEVCGLNYTYFDIIRPPEPYSTDIAAAWLVVEEMRRRGYSVLICFDEQPTTKCEAEFTRTDEDDREHHGWVFNESAPLAICQAALAAMEPKATDR